MEKFIKWLKTRNFIAHLRIIIELINEYKTLSKHLGAFNTYKKKEKLEADITIKVHAIEKGLAMANPRVGFGEQKIEDLLNVLNSYRKCFGDIQFLNHSIPVLESYFNFNIENQYSNQILFEKFNKLKQTLKVNPCYRGGTINLSKNYITANSQINFDEFINSRYSIRDFSDDPIDEKLIINALQISRKTPSSCNRQAWKVHVFRDKIKKKELLEFQGNRGFIDQIDTAIIVSCSLNSFFIHERHQAYIDGGLYAMTLIYALHSQGLGTIPLTMAMTSSKMNIFYKKFNIEKELVPILIIGVGNLKENFKVALSERKNIEEYVKFI